MQEKSLGAPPVKDVELKTGIGRKQSCNLVQPLSQRGKREQRIFTLPQLVIIHVQAESEQVDGDRVGECGGSIVGAGLFVGASGAVAQSLFAELESIQAALAAYTVGNLRPDQVGKLGRKAGNIHKCVSYIDVELKRYREPVFQQTRGDKHILSIAGFDIAMADGAVRERAVVLLRDERLVAFAERERNKVECFAVECRGNRARHGINHAFQVGRRQIEVPGGGIADAVGRLDHSYFADDILRVSHLQICRLCHGVILTYSRIMAAMSKFFLSAGIGLATGVICFFISVAFLCFVLLAVRAFTHTQMDMTLTYRVAAPVALLAALCGFGVTLVRTLRARTTH